MTMTFQHDDLPLALYSAAQVRDLDARLIAAGTPGFELMQRAAHADICGIDRADLQRCAEWI
ncbi:hypothetical protein, partial [Pseudomonas aeruginosa]|uniref:hypothetical protein n=1 Tax=Pseudomonas aeruginosa TaxID=287 RepID=UPI000EC7DEC4